MALCTMWDAFSNYVFSVSQEVTIPGCPKLFPFVILKTFSSMFPNASKPCPDLQPPAPYVLRFTDALQAEIHLIFISDHSDLLMPCTELVQWVGGHETQDHRLHFLNGH
ncbi:hypothetical protein HPP92_028844 [Vanilla planifolia]|uniref:Uncharacterized protein n=1 Tax=Vanilla planifolia TaxID=51239 RepID=A0A835P714_VANPL|nr:hypothetical protein HPP92_028844 [Vanilla planifolia]KAG0446439.1 hypothetical protein HPP92_028833 [Vanilla planifolia]